MNSKKKTLSMLLTLAALSLIATGCATVPPPELVAARSAYKHASLARAEAPAELHKAKSSLDVAEAAYSDKPKAQSTRDLAYVAQRKAQLATAIARTRVAERQQKLAEEQYRAQQEKSARKTTEVLAATRGDLAAGEQALAGERAGRREAEARAAAYAQRAKDAMDALAKLAAVKQESRGLVITLSGSVLFASNKSQLLTSAQTRLNQVSKALLETKDRTLTVEGHTDSQGSDAYNLKLSKRRADAVRAYLISRGYPAAQIQAQGVGEERPVTDNGTAEGRANNRRVEIVVSPRTASASL